MGRVDEINIGMSGEEVYMEEWPDEKNLGKGGREEYREE